MCRLSASINFNSDTAKGKLSAILSALREEDLSIYEIADIIYLSVAWTRGYVNYLREEGLIHISGRRVDNLPSYGSNEVRRVVYAFGAGKDNDEIKSISQMERVRLKKLREKEKEDDLRANKRHKTNYVIQRDPLVAAFFGNP